MQAIKYFTPRINTSDVVKQQLDLYEVIHRTYTQYKFHSEQYKIPVCAAIHPQAIRNLAGNKSLLIVAMGLTTFLNDIKLGSVVTVPQSDLALITELSLKTVILSIEALEELGYVSHVGKQTYKLSPRLCWFGKQADWAIALKLDRDKEKSNES